MSSSPAIQRIFDEGLAAAIPEGLISTSGWAERYRVVDRGARKGKWQNSTVPFLVEIMDAFDDPDVREIIFQKSSQVAGSEAINNMIGKTIHLEPTEMAYVAEKEDKATAWTQESFDTMVRTTPVLRNLIRQEPEFNNQKKKCYPGGQLTIAWASSPAELSSRPLQKIFFDEKAAYVPTKEGDAVKLGEARTKTYSGVEKIVKISSPRNANDDSDIEKDFLRGDQREYYVPCPQCNEFQTLKWANVKWEDPATPYMVCEVNGCLIDYEDQEDMLAKGRWIAAADFTGVASFKISQLYSPFVPWTRMVQDFLDAKHSNSQAAMQVWVNTALGEPWRPEERIEYADLQLAREDYPAPVPAGVLLLTAAVDVQGDRLEAMILGWGRDDEVWAIDYRVIEGSPSLPEVWDALTDYLTTPLDGELREFHISAVCIDSGGHHTQMVYRFCKANSGRRWFAVKGSSTPQAPLIAKPSLVGQNPKVRLFSIGTNAAKDTVFSYLKVSLPGPGFCHFPADDRFDDAFLKQLCSEKKVPRFRFGREVYVYEKVSASARNEALDLFVYNLAAKAILNPNYDKIAARRLQHIEQPAAAESMPADNESGSVHKTVENAPKPAKKKPFAIKSTRFSRR